MHSVVGLGRIGLVAFFVGLVMVEPRARLPLARYAMTAAAAATLVALVIVCASHVPFAWQLETMEDTVLQHAVRAAHGLPIYPAPTPGYVPLAYNPGFYYLAAPFVWMFGATLPTLRGVAVLGLIGCAVIVFLAVSRQTGSRWWAFVALGLFAAAYRVMDSALDNAHSDSWMLCAALLGTYLIARTSSRLGAIAGVLACVASFWFKQHGALFAVGAVVFLTWRDGPRRAWPYWLAAIVAGPVLYLACGRMLFGPYFHYFTFDVPSGWSEPGLPMVPRLVGFFGRAYGLLVVAAAGSAVIALRQPRERASVWHFQLPFALLTAVQGTLDPGSSDNVFIAAGAWLIIVGTIGIAQAGEIAPGFVGKRDWRLAAVAIALAPLLYDPRSEILSPAAPSGYADLVTYVHGLPGPVYAPDVGQSPGTPLFWPAANWVALEDMSRGPRRSEAERQAALALLDPVLHPPKTAFILTLRPLEDMRPPVSTASARYTVVAVLGDRFRSLAGPPKHFAPRWPRLLYRYSPSPTGAQ